MSLHSETRICRFGKRSLQVSIDEVGHILTTISQTLDVHILDMNEVSDLPPRDLRISCFEFKAYEIMFSTLIQHFFQKYLNIYENVIFPGYYSKRPGLTDPRRLQILQLLLRGGADVRMTKTFTNTLEGGRIESLLDPPLTYLYKQRPFNLADSESKLAMLKLLLAYGTIYFFFPLISWVQLVK